MSDGSAAPAAGAMGRRRSIALFGIALFLFWVALYIYVPTLPVYAEKKRGAPLELVGLILASYGLTQFLLRIPLGLASDRSGRRKPFVLGGMAAATLSCLILAWAPGPGWLLVGRGLAGVAASSWVAATVLFASYFRPEQAVRAASLAAFLSGSAQMVGSGAGGRLADAAGWLAPFQAGVLAALLAAAFMIPVRDEVVERRQPLTLAGFRRVIGRRPLLVAAGVAAVGQWLSQSTTFGFVPSYAASVLGASPTALGGLATLTQLAYTLTSLGSAAVAQRVAPRGALILGLLVVGVSTAAVPLARSLPTLAAARALFGAGYGLIYPVAMGLSISGVPGEERASAMGIFQALYAIGMFVGPAVSGWLAARAGLPGMFWLTGLLPLPTAVAVAWLARTSNGRALGAGVGIERE